MQQAYRENSGRMLFWNRYGLGYQAYIFIIGINRWLRLPLLQISSRHVRSFLLRLNYPKVIDSIKLSTKNLPLITLLMFATMSATQFAAFYWDNYFFLMTFKVLAALFCLAAAVFFGRLQQKIIEITQALRGTALLREEKTRGRNSESIKNCFFGEHESRN